MTINNLIFNLAQEAGLVQYKTDSKMDNVNQYTQLIVQQCIYNMESCGGDLDFAIWLTKKDFGVE